MTATSSAGGSRDSASQQHARQAVLPTGSYELTNNTKETNLHGPECPQSNRPVWGDQTCQCVACHCGSQHIPGGFLGTCQGCGRKQTQTQARHG